MSLAILTANFPTLVPPNFCTIHLAEGSMVFWWRFGGVRGGGVSKEEEEESDMIESLVWTRIADKYIKSVLTSEFPRTWKWTRNRSTLCFYNRHKPFDCRLANDSIFCPYIRTEGRFKVRDRVLLQLGFQQTTTPLPTTRSSAINFLEIGLYATSPRSVTPYPGHYFGRLVTDIDLVADSCHAVLRCSHRAFRQRWHWRTKGNAWTHPLSQYVPSVIGFELVFQNDLWQASLSKSLWLCLIPLALTTSSHYRCVQTANLSHRCSCAVQAHKNRIQAMYGKMCIAW